MAFPSGKSISVKVIDLVSVSGMANEMTYAPPVEGIETFPTSPSLCFLLEHESGRKVLFDLGVAHDRSKLGDKLNADLADYGWKVDVKDDVAAFLTKNGITLSSIEAVIWSHTHWDHKGDLSTFPPNTELIVGPTTIDKFIHGNGNGPYGGIIKEDIQGRHVREIKCNMKVGPFMAMDFFDDGSLYLLDSPGHDHGHICALARTTASDDMLNPNTFVLLGGDAAHHCSELRPSRYLQMPNAIIPNPQTGLMDHPLCPGDWFREINSKRGLNPDGPLYRPAFAIASMEQALQTIEKIQELDGNENVLCILSHDPSVRRAGIPIPFFPDALNDWKKGDLRKHMNWSWVGDVWDELQRTKKEAK